MRLSLERSPDLLWAYDAYPEDKYREDAERQISKGFPDKYLKDIGTYMNLEIGSKASLHKAKQKSDY